MRRLVVSLAVLCLLAAPLYAEGPTLEERVGAFLGAKDPVERLHLGMEVAAAEESVVPVHAPTS